MHVYLFIYVLLLEIQLSRGGGLDPINWFTHTTFLWLSKTRSWIYNVIYCGLSFVFSELRWDVNISGIDVKLSFQYDTSMICRLWCL